MKIEIKKDDYFDYGEQVYLEIEYENEEQEKEMYELFENFLLPFYGANSVRAKEGKKYIIPYLKEDKQNNKKIVTSVYIPRELLADFIKRFIEVDHATIKYNGKEMKDKFDYKEFEEYISSLDLKIELKKDEYFQYGQKYFVEFNYGTKTQEKKMSELFEKYLIPFYGANSTRVQEGKEYLMPFLKQKSDSSSSNDFNTVGGSSIPADMLAEFIRRFVEVDHAIVKIGDVEIRDTFDYEYFEELLEGLNNNKTK